MKKKLLIAITIFTLLVASAAVYIWHEYNRKIQNTNNLTASCFVDATALIRDFEQAEKKANQKYLGKVVAVSGPVKTFDRDPSGNCTLVIGDEMSTSSIRCRMLDQQIDDSVIFFGKTPVTLKGVCTGYTADDMGLGADVILTRCVFEKSSNH